jgi:adenylate kinase family enzyme
MADCGSDADPRRLLVRRVVVVGSSGSGKTTVARALARRLEAHFVELDALHHGPNWTEATAAELRDAVTRELAGRDAWVVDGNYHGKLGDLVLRQTDTVVWLDLPLRTCLARLWARTMHRVRTDEELWNGNRETWRGAFWGRDSLFWWTIRHYRGRRRRWPKRFARLPNSTVVRLRTPSEIDRFLASAPPA